MIPRHLGSTEDMAENSTLRRSKRSFEWRQKMVERSQAQCPQRESVARHNLIVVTPTSGNYDDDDSDYSNDKDYLQNPVASGNVCRPGYTVDGPNVVGWVQCFPRWQPIKTAVSSKRFYCHLDTSALLFYIPLTSIHFTADSKLVLRVGESVAVKRGFLRHCHGENFKVNSYLKKEGRGIKKKNFTKQWKLELYIYFDSQAIKMKQRGKTLIDFTIWNLKELNLCGKRPCIFICTDS